MLPSKGYFINIVCPFKQCMRPYCHYRHCKEDRDAPKEQSTEEIIQDVVKSTMKEVLSSSGVQENVISRVSSETNKIISNVLNNIKNKPILNEAPSDAKPSYNPTPISKLSGRHIPVALPPSKPTYSNIVRAKKTNINVALNEPKKFRSYNSTPETFSRPSGTASSEANIYQIGPNTSNSKSPEAEHCAEINSKMGLSESATIATCFYPDETNQHSQDLQMDVMNESGECHVTNPNETHFNIDKPSSSPKEEHFDSVSDLKPDLGNERILNSDSNSLEEENNIDKAIDNDKDNFSSNVNKIASNSLEPQCFDSREKRKHLASEEPIKKPKLEENNVECAIDLTLRNETDVDSKDFDSKGSDPTLIINMKKYDVKHDSRPPIKKMKSSKELNSSDSSTATPPEVLCERWKKAREKISLSDKSKSTPKILPVSNVQMLLKVRDKPTQSTNLKRKIEPPPISEVNLPIEIPVLKPKVRSSRISFQNTLKYPTILFEENCIIPFSVRNQAIRSIFDEFCKYIDPDVAHDSAQKLELDICKRVQVVKTYKNSVAVALFRIRKQKGLIYEVESKKEILLPYSTPSFTNGWTLYRCFSEYLLTDEQYKNNGFPIAIKDKNGCAYIEKSARRRKLKQPSDKFQQICDHCSKNYFVDNKGFPLKEFDCFYHWGKIRRQRMCGGFVDRFTCCGGDEDSEPCTNGKYHVCNLFDDDFLNGFVTTKSKDKRICLPGIFGIDCEMCYTTKGVELTRCTLVDLNGQKVYDKIVVPDNPIIDYCTRFSGITEDIMKTSNLTLKDIQQDLISIINERTILVGHSLENDLKVLKIFHKALVDTSVVFPHKNGLPLKLSLKKIAKDLLNLTIQENENGHDSYEDANACIKIMLWKIKEDAKRRKPRTIISLDPNKSKENLNPNKF